MKVAGISKLWESQLRRLQQAYHHLCEKPKYYTQQQQNSVHTSVYCAFFGMITS